MHLKSNKPSGKVSILALSVALIIGSMFIYGKETQHQSPSAQATAAAATASILKPSAFNQAPVIDEVVVTAKRIEPMVLGFDAPALPDVKVAVVAPKAPKKFWSAS